jgi:hypothetical protein
MGRRGLSDGAPARFGKRREAPHGRRLPEGGEEVARAIHVDEAVRVVRPFACGDGVDGVVEVRGRARGGRGSERPARTGIMPGGKFTGQRRRPKTSWSAEARRRPRAEPT